jgi:hypothetical protein
MRRAWKLLSWLSICCLGLGCMHTSPKRPEIKPPKEEFHVPPEGLFKEPVKYPEGMLNHVQPRRPKDDDDERFTTPGSGGMGGPGMAGPGVGAAGMPR